MLVMVETFCSPCSHAAWGVTQLVAILASACVTFLGDNDAPATRLIARAKSRYTAFPSHTNTPLRHERSLQKEVGQALAADKKALYLSPLLSSTCTRLTLRV